MADEEKQETRGRKKESLLDKALKAYEIKTEHVLGEPVEGDGFVRFVTTGGRKITYRDGDEVQYIPRPLLTGEAPPSDRPGLTPGKKQK